MLFQQSFLFPDPTGFDVKPLSSKFSFALLSPSDNCYLSRRIRTNSGARGYLSLIRLPMKIGVASGTEDNVIHAVVCTMEEL